MSRSRPARRQLRLLRRHSPGCYRAGMGSQIRGLGRVRAAGTPGLVTRTWCDPCPECGAAVTGFDCEAVTIRSNPESVITIPDPGCPHRGDPGTAEDCTCTVIPNPCPPSHLDQVHVVAHVYTLFPCRHQTRDGIRFYQETRPVPGTLGELMADWAAAEYDG